MLHVLRQHKNSKAVWATLALIIGVFTFWGVGVGINGGEEMNRVASVDGRPIEQLDLLRAENNLVQSYREALKGQFTPELRKMFNLRQKALDALIDRQVLSQRAADLGLTVADQELRDAISANPAFLSGGRFSKESYLRALRYSSLTPAAFEDDLRRQISIERLQRAVTDGVTIDDKEVRDAMIDDERKVTVRIVRVKASDHVSGVVPDEGAIRAFYDGKIDRYSNPEQIKLELIAYPFAKFEAGPPSELDVSNYYSEHLADRFHEQAQVRARHILVKVPEDADEKTRGEARGRLAALRKRVEAGADFAKLARESSEDPGSAAQGGDLGFFARGRMVKPFEDAAFALGPGQLSEIVETPFGFHLIRADEVRPERDKPYEEVRAQIVSEMVTNEARLRSEEVAKQGFAEWKAGKSPDEIATARGLEVVRAGPVSRSGSLPGLGTAMVVTNALWPLAPGELVGPIEANGNWVIARQVEKVSPGPKPFDEVKDEVEKAWRLEEGGKAAKAKAEKILAAATSEGLEKAAVAAGEKVEKPEAFGRGGGNYVPGIGSSAKIKSMALQLSRARPLADAVVEVAGDAYIVEYDSEAVPSEEDLAKRLPEARKKALGRRQQDVFARYLEELKKRARIEVDRQKIEALPAV